MRSRDHARERRVRRLPRGCKKRIRSKRRCLEASARTKGSTRTIFMVPHRGTMRLTALSRTRARVRSQTCLGLSTRTEIWVPPLLGFTPGLRGRENSFAPTLHRLPSPRRLIPLLPAGAHPDQRSIRRAPGRRSHDVRASRALWHSSKIDRPFHRSLGQVGFGFRGVQTVFQLQAGHVGQWRRAVSGLQYCMY